MSLPLERVPLMAPLGQASAFSTIITSTKVEMTDSDKHSSLLRNVIDYGPNFFL
jgi:hypothetical protein